MKESPKKDRSKKLFKQHTELEILVSAAIVFAAVNSRDVVLDLTFNLLNSNFANNSFFLAITILTGLIAATIFPISIITHLVLRSYWLSLVGLKLAFENKEGKALNFSDRYERTVSKYLDLDTQIRKMDKITSSVFSFSFLILFSFLFSLLFMVAFVYLINVLSNFLGDSQTADIFVYIILVLTLLSSLLYAIDFFGLGVLKRIKKNWFQAIYFRVYQFFSLITFARLYRGIYYTLISQVSKKIVFVVLPLYVIITLIAINLGYNSYLYYPIDSVQNQVFSSMYVNGMYRDELNNRTPLYFPIIQSRTISSESHIQLFIPLGLQLEDSLQVHCSNIKPFDDRGINWEKHFRVGDSGDSANGKENLKNAENILGCISDKITISLNDSIISGLKYRFSRINEPDRAGVETFFSIKGIETGNHVVIVSSPDLFGDKVYKIPFWRD